MLSFESYIDQSFSNNDLQHLVISQVATAPNAIVFGASTMTVADMMKGGIGLNIITLITTAIAINTYATPIFSLNTFPDWANVANGTCPSS